MDKIYEENKITLNISSRMKNKQAFKEFLKDFNLEELKNKLIDEKIYEVMKSFYQNNLFNDLYNNVFNEEFHDWCDEYCTAVAIVLQNLNTDLSLMYAFVINKEKFDKGVIEHKEPSEKYKEKGYIPHIFLSVAVNDNKYIFEPKYFKIKDDELISTISAKYHSNLNPNIMKIPHQDDPKKSRLFFDYKKIKNDKYNFKGFPLFIKDKKGEEEIYKVFEVAELK